MTTSIKEALNFVIGCALEMTGAHPPHTIQADRQLIIDTWDTIQEALEFLPIPIKKAVLLKFEVILTVYKSRIEHEEFLLRTTKNQY